MPPKKGKKKSVGGKGKPAAEKAEDTQPTAASQPETEAMVVESESKDEASLPAAQTEQIKTAPSSSLNPEKTIKLKFLKDISVRAHTSQRRRLDVNGYLEKTLWAEYHEDVSFEHTMSVVIMVNERCNNDLSPFQLFSKDNVKCSLLFSDVVDLLLKDQLENDFFLESFVIFWVNAFHHLEDSVIKENTLKYLSISIWEALSDSRLKLELEQNPDIQKLWEERKNQRENTSSLQMSTETNPKLKESAKKRKRKSDPVDISEKEVTETVGKQSKRSLEQEASFIPTLLKTSSNVFLLHSSLAPSTYSSKKPVEQEIRFQEYVAELLIDLLSQLPTRRFLRVLLDDMHFIPLAKHSLLLENPNAKLLKKLIQNIDDSMHFEVDDFSGRGLTTQEMMEKQTRLIHRLQKLAYTEFKSSLKDVIFCSVGELGKRPFLSKQLEYLNSKELLTLARKLNIVTNKDSFLFSTSEEMRENTSSNIEESGDLNETQVGFVKELILTSFIPRASLLDQLNHFSLYPTENLLWDSDQIPLTSAYTGTRKHPKLLVDPAETTVPANSTHSVLALPKLNLQFLTIYDYLLRNFTLFRLETAYGIRGDIVDAVRRIGSKQSANGGVTFSGWARMALPILSLGIDEVAKPLLGEIIPRRVDCTVTVDLSSYSGEILAEWENLREHDVLFLICIENPKATNSMDGTNIDEESWEFAQILGIKYVRGAELFEMRDEAGNILNDPTKPDQSRIGKKRKLRLHLDPSQYHQDLKDGVSCYDRVNLLIRRSARENTFKAILDTIRGLINSSALGRAVPSWLEKVFLGYGDPSAAHYRNLRSVKSFAVSSTDLDENDLENGDYGDTFVDYNHLIQSFPDMENIIFEKTNGETIPVIKDKKQVIKENKTSTLPSPPYILSFQHQDSGNSGIPTQPRKKSKKEETQSEEIINVNEHENKNENVLIVKEQKQGQPGPYPEDQPRKNSLKFTPTQIEAVRSGLNRGLTLIVGPPGTGKTDVAVQIAATLYRRHPTQRILLIAHSNAALNDLFEKILERDVDPRHLLRLGAGEQELRGSLAIGGAKGSGKAAGEAFSKQGRVHWSLSRRLQLLAQVQRLASSLLGLNAGDVGYTCETANYFELQHISPRISAFLTKVKELEKTKNNAAALGVKSSSIEEIFPFKTYFQDTPNPLFTGDWESDLESAKGCFRHLQKLFIELQDYRAFELLRTQSLRTDYLLTKQARIVAMTCTHAAMTRGKLVELGFKYDSLIMEEAAQVLEVETLIPMLLQDSDPLANLTHAPGAHNTSDTGTGKTPSGSRLQRVVLLGDHHQLPPVIKHQAFQKFSHLDQSLFTRFIRLGVPAILLDQQGRARPEIAALYSWRYTIESSVSTMGGGGERGSLVKKTQQLGNLPMVAELPEYLTANAGFSYTYQFVNVPEFKGKGEFCPTPYFYQNLGEAEYVVAVYQYMRLIGYPASKISILTTYNGQKHLIQDILAQRCRNELFGMPATVSTVDKYQGQQNDYILLSLVRTESVGHLRDVRRLVVALSRARLGLYVFGRKELFQNCFELSTAFNMLLSRPVVLTLTAGEETYPTQRGKGEQGNGVVVEDVTAMGVKVFQMVQKIQNLVSG